MRSEQRKKEFGEVFTPVKLVNEMIDAMKDFIPIGELINPYEIVGDITGCGNGNFLVVILEQRMNSGISHADALLTMYGVDIMEDNIQECKERLAMGSKSKKIWEVLDNNIICADALDPKHSGWDKVGYMWELPEHKQFWD